MTQTRNKMLAATFALLVLSVANVHASNAAIIVEQEFDNPHCRGAPIAQVLVDAVENYCFTGFDEPGATNFVNVIDISTGHVVASKVNSLSLTCERPPSFSTGQTCEKHFTKTIGSFCFAYYDNNQFSYAIRYSCYPCRPVNTITKAHCNSLIQQCENFEIFEGSDVNPFPVQMKWTGRGCRVDGKPVGDGGCQCDDYCGYTCERACNADSQCYWDTTSNQCFSAETNSPGEPIKLCLPENEYEGEVAKGPVIKQLSSGNIFQRLTKH